MKNETYSLADIIRSQKTTGQSFSVIFRFILIPAAWPFAWLLLRLGLGPNQTTTLRVPLQLVSFCLIAWPSGQYWEVGLILFFVAVVLDCADGHICRVTNTASYFGKFFDGMVDSLMEIPLPLVLGLGEWYRSGNHTVLIAGAFASLFFALAQISILRYAMISRDLEIAKLQGIKPRIAFSPIAKIIIEKAWFLKITHFFDYTVTLLAFDYRYGGLAVMALLGMIDLYLYLLALIHFIMYVAFFIARTLHATTSLNAWRRSRSSIETKP